MSIEGGLFELDVKTFEDVELLMVPCSADDVEVIWVDVMMTETGMLANRRVRGIAEACTSPFADSPVLCNAFREVARSLSDVLCSCAAASILVNYERLQMGGDSILERE